MAKKVSMRLIGIQCIKFGGIRLSKSAFGQTKKSTNVAKTVEIRIIEHTKKLMSKQI
jgi:hypothetical protein